MRDARQNEVDKVVETSLTRCVPTGERLQCKALYSYVRCCRRETLSMGIGWSRFPWPQRRPWRANDTGGCWKVASIRHLICPWQPMRRAGHRHSGETLRSTCTSVTYLVSLRTRTLAPGRQTRREARAAALPCRFRVGRTAGRDDGVPRRTQGYVGTHRLDVRQDKTRQTWSRSDRDESHHGTGWRCDATTRTGAGEAGGRTMGQMGSDDDARTARATGEKHGRSQPCFPPQ